ncbi:MAG: type II toxin-antitoxin system RelE/ParE family toxin [Pseudomonadota bacterium]
MPLNEAKRIVDKIAQYADDPDTLAINVTCLVGRKGIRLRVRNWRVIMDDGVVLDVLDIGPRSRIYR